jgi:hypothetical protein
MKHMKCLTTPLLFFYITGQAQKNNDTLLVPKLVFDSKGELIITPSATSSKNDFDFLIGPHKVHHKILKARLSSSTEWKEFEGTHDLQIILNGIGNMERHQMVGSDNKPVEGMALRLFNPVTKLWSIYWANSNSGVLGLPPEVGSFENKVGHFFSKGIFDGKNVITVFRWDARDADNPVWSQALSIDNGKTWEWNWYMYMSKVK